MKRVRTIAVVAVGVSALVLVGCGGDDGSGADGAVVEISAHDDLRFEPSSVTVSAGEPVTFVVINEGETVHEFVLGPEMVQMAHEEMSAEGMEHEEMEVEGQLAALAIEPGETEEVTVTFEEPGEMPFGCHEPGHFDGGMVGTVTVE